MKAWYFSTDDMVLRYGDNRKIRTGITHTVDCEPILCKQGLHRSKRIIDALDCAPGNIVWRVELTGKIVHGSDKVSATNRKYLWGVDCNDILKDFARRCALDVIHLWDAPDVVISYLKTGSVKFRAVAEAAAEAAARDSARAARAAAWMAWDAEVDAAMAKQNNRLTQMVVRGKRI
jgi:hypothetical protein